MMARATMNAAVTTEWKKIEVREVPIPVPGDKQVRIRTTLAGICGSDAHIYLGHHPTAKAPVTQGHEFVGVIDALGAGAPESLKVGQKVVVEPLISCGTCEACRRGLAHVCRKLNLLGIHQDGAFAEYLLAPAAKVIAAPEGMSDRMAVLAEPFAVGVHVCRRAAMQPGSRALVVGAGPIGLIVAMVAQSAGAEVTLSEISPARLQQAEAFGFTTINAKENPAERAMKLTDGDGYDTVFEVSGSEPGLALAIEAARVRGTIVQVGFYGKPPAADLFRLALKELSIVGSRVYTHEDFRRSVRLLDRLAKSGAFELEKLICEQTTLAGITDAIERMIAGRVTGKVIVDPSKK